MNREEFYQQQMARSANAAQRIQEIQPLYTACRFADTSDEFNDAFAELWNKATPYCFRIIVALTHASQHATDDILQEISLALFEKLQVERQSGGVSPNFSAYISEVSRGKAFDFGRSRTRYNKRFFEIVQNDMDDCYESNRSIDDFADASTPETDFEDKAKVKLVHWILTAYAERLFSYEQLPQKALANCYARVLYQLDYFFGSNSTNNKESSHWASSADWAFVRMNKKTFSYLARESEQIVQWQLSPSIVWCHSFTEHLEQLSDLVSPPRALKELVYTCFFGKEAIAKWTESIHDSVLKQVASKLQNDPYYYALANEYIAKGSKLYKLLVRGGNER